MKAKEVLKITNISRETLCRLVKKKIIRVETLPNGRYSYNEDDVYAYAGIKRQSMNVIYARVSTEKQSNEIAEQISRLEKFCAANGYKIDKIYKDVASGINFEKRKEFFEMLQLVLQHRVSKVFIVYKDRLSRAGFELFQYLFSNFGCQIIVINESGNEALDSEELFEEMEMLIQSFSMKDFSKRKLNKIKEILKARN